MCKDKAAEKDALHMALQLHRMNLTDLSSASIISRHLLVMIQHQCGTNKAGPPVHICVCCGESAPSHQASTKSTRKHRLQFVLLQLDRR